MQTIGRRWMVALSGLAAGVLNGLFGAGGGLIAVPLLRKAGLETKAAHATSIAIILPISVFTVLLYLLNRTISLQDALPYLPGSLLGAVGGGLLMRNIPPLWLRRVFGGFMVWAAIRLLLR